MKIQYVETLKAELAAAEAIVAEQVILCFSATRNSAHPNIFGACLALTSNIYSQEAAAADTSSQQQAAPAAHAQANVV